MTEILVKIMVELLSVLALATKQIKKGRFSKCSVTCILLVIHCATEKFTKKFLGEKEIEDALHRLNRLIEDEIQMTVTQTLDMVHGLVQETGQRNIQAWLSPPDPSTNHNSTLKARHSGTAAWFFASNALTEWKSGGSLLWIHGKRMFFESPKSAMH